MDKQLVQLFPPSSKKVDLEKLYLQQHGWYSPNQSAPSVVANFVTSIDGRIAISSNNAAAPQLPKSLISKEDFRLFLELCAQADCLITHGGYLRALAENKLGNILQLPIEAKYDDLRAWRQDHGLASHPDIVIASSSLNFPIHPSLHDNGQKIYIATGVTSDFNRRKEWQKQGYEILLTGKSSYTQGLPLIEELAKRNYLHIYLIAGPKMLHAMVQDRQLDKLYLSTSHQLLGGEIFRTLLDGDVLTDCTLKLKSLFYDKSSENNCSQFFSNYECIYNNN